MKRIAKAVGALLGSVTGAGVVALFAAFDVTIPLALAGAIAVILATVGAYLAPANEV